MHLRNGLTFQADLSTPRTLDQVTWESNYAPEPAEIIHEPILHLLTLPLLFLPEETTIKEPDYRLPLPLPHGGPGAPLSGPTWHALSPQGTVSVTNHKTLPVSLS